MPSPQDARSSLWARYDAGELDAGQLDARLRAVDAAGVDEAALERALTGPVRTPRRGRPRLLPLVGGALVVVALVASFTMFGGDSDPTGAGPGVDPGIDPTEPGIPFPEPVPEPLECDALDDALARLEGVDGNEPPGNPGLLSDPPALPDGYSVAEEVDLVPGSDPDLSMDIAAGNPLPDQIVARQLLGPLTVTMRTFVYSSADDAGTSALSVVDDAFCSYDATAFDVPDRPQITGSTVTGIIPTTAFASWRLAERRFTVSVVAAADGGPPAVAEAEALAGLIAGLELDAAREVQGGADGAD